MPDREQALKTGRELIVDAEFKARHPSRAKAFTRSRRLTFPLVITLLLRKGVQSLQNMVNEAVGWLAELPVTGSAFSQIRYKLRYTAFIELNEAAVVGTVYADSGYRTFWGFRVLAVDGSKILLPDTADVRAAFGTIAYSNGTPETAGERPYALASVLYDVLNRVGVEAVLGPAKAYGVDLAIAHLACTRPGDLLVMDRNYPSYRMLAELTRHGRDFVVRCSAASFAPARQMLKGEGPDSQVVTLRPCAEQAPEIGRLGLPPSLRVRFVRVRLSTGEWEVLVTSLLDDTRYPTEGFLELYGLRWRLETFYGILKTRLDLENFTGLTAEAVRPDFHATVYLTGLEAILTADAQQRLDAKKILHPQTVNRAVSFNAIKHHALELLCSDLSTTALAERLTALFLTSPTTDRPQRNPPRKMSSSRALLDFHKRRKRHCY
ncbi:IS4 family transposase [uncultured Thiodictyon sp.]|uniref:IS4 family transposase n=1 Tax=uncultured Thiodictyon sp. TaxID=1846217 RepID=UPI0025D62BA5|nr:IS4 family transposase [uncultured Thiodictyon sp.]